MAHGSEYRRRRQAILDALVDPSELGREVVAVLAERRNAIAPLAARLTQLMRRGAVSLPLETIFRSFVHMHCNRLLRADLDNEGRVIGLLLRAREAMAHMPRIAKTGT